MVPNNSHCKTLKVSPLGICLSEGFVPKTEEFKQCIIDLLEKKTEKSKYLLLDPCQGGKSHRLMLVSEGAKKEFVSIKEKYLKEKSYGKWILYKLFGINFF